MSSNIIEIDITNSDWPNFDLAILAEYEYFPSSAHSGRESETLHWSKIKKLKFWIHVALIKSQHLDLKNLIKTVCMKVSFSFGYLSLNNFPKG